MVNKAKPEVIITLDRERRMVFDLNAMVKYEEISGKNIFDGFDKNSMSAKDIRDMLWVCLLEDDPELTPEQLGKMIHPGNMADIQASLNLAFEAAAPEESSGDEEEPNENPLPGSESPG